jgi:16S rRNA (cytidine1402-2'-O)-methyltransferase
MLYIVSTPIGNLKDITLRALEVLKSVDLIACEDTRHTKILLDHYQIKKPLTSYHSYNKIKKAEELLGLLKQNKSVALVADSGTPGISDPGTHLVRLCLDSGIPLTAIPGPSAFVTALVISGLPTHRFVFEGFLPKKPGARKKRLKELSQMDRTVILYESCWRITKLLEEILAVMGDISIVCTRELTKKFEEIKSGKVSQLLQYFNLHRPRGEFVIIFSQ